MSFKNFASNTKTKTASTSQMVPARADQVRNDAGGYVFSVGKWERLNRFLILGSEGGTYYAGERKLTKDNAANVISCIKEDGFRVVKTIVEVSKQGRAPKNDPALLALALCATHGNNDVKNFAMKSLPQVARIGTHLFHFAEFVNGMRGWGRVLREGIRDWYQDMPVAKLAEQVIKYQQRDGWSHRDLIRLSHPKAEDALRNSLYKYVVKGAEAIAKGEMMPEIIIGAEFAKTADTSNILQYIEKYNLPREVIPTHLLNCPEVWEALLAKQMPLTAMIRNLGKMTAVGVLGTRSQGTKQVVEALTNAEALRKARVHPFSILLALSVYVQGHGDKGSLMWTPNTDIKKALNEAFYLAFKSLEPSGKNTLVALDVSGSMGGAYLQGSRVTAREAALAMAMTRIRTEPVWELVGFTGGMVKLPQITPNTTLEEGTSAISRLPFDRTDCAQPMLWAIKNKVEVDVFEIYTDNETWAGGVHPYQALKQYRQVMGRPAKLVVVGMTSSGFTIADPNDAGMMDVVGFDTSAPNVMAAFAKDEL
jgi:60 kDa SS-A/Ro ribonucleoprotein